MCCHINLNQFLWIALRFHTKNTKYKNLPAFIDFVILHILFIFREKNVFGKALGFKQLQMDQDI